MRDRMLHGPTLDFPHGIRDRLVRVMLDADGEPWTVRDCEPCVCHPKGCTYVSSARGGVTMSAARRTRSLSAQGYVHFS
jgi:hypothetical protein